MSSHARSRLARGRRRARRTTSIRPVRPTAATAARLRPDPLLVLLQSGRLVRDDLDAAFDIRRAFETITAPVRLRTMRTITTAEGTAYDLTKGSRSPGSDNESVHEIDLQQRFSSWANAMHEAKIPIGPVVDMVVEGKSGRSVDRERGRRNGWAVDLLVEALEIYRAAPSSKPRQSSQSKDPATRPSKIVRGRST